MFWKRRQKDFIIQCPSCEWQTDDKNHWACDCGHQWNTFTTKGICPKCKRQWEETGCPACHKSNLHSAWYHTQAAIALLETSGNQVLRAKKKKLEARLIDYGIHYYRISHLPYLDHSKEQFYTEYEAGCRMIILAALSSVVYHLDQRKALIKWLKEEKIWEKVSPKEKAFLIQPNPDQITLMDFSWKIESALTLGWCLQLVEELPRLDQQDNLDLLEAFIASIPSIGDSTALFLTQLEYRNLREIYEENLLNELITTYFRDLLFNGQEDQTNINRHSSFERHWTLNWWRKFSQSGQEPAGLHWDETDTST